MRRRSPHAPRPRAFRAPARPASPRKSDGRHSVTLPVPRPALTRARASCRRMPGCAWHSMPEKCAPFGPDRSSFVTEWWGAARGHSRVTHPLYDARPSLIHPYPARAAVVALCPNTPQVQVWDAKTWKLLATLAQASAVTCPAAAYPQSAPRLVVTDG